MLPGHPAPIFLSRISTQAGPVPNNESLPPHRHAHIPERDDFTSKDHGQAERYRLTREAVLKHLIEEPSIQHLFASWDQTTGLLKLAEAVAHASEEQKPVAYGQFIERVRALPQLLNTEPAQAAVSWELPYHFVSNGVVNEYILQRAAVAHGVPFKTWSAIQKDDLRIALTIRGHASDQEVESLFERIRQARNSDALAPGRAPKTNKKNADTTATKGAHLDRNARWVVCHNVGKIPPIELAREHFGQEFQKLTNPVSTITKGIKSAQELLNLTTYVIPSTLARK